MVRLPVWIATQIDERLCFGLVCDGHQHCARYVAVDGAPAALVRRIGTCRDEDGRYPLFVNAACSVSVLSVEVEAIA
jgi:hypothetical protein